MFFTAMHCTTVMASLIYVLRDRSKLGKERTEDTSVSLDLTCNIFALFHHPEKQKPEYNKYGVKEQLKL